MIQVGGGIQVEARNCCGGYYMMWVCEIKYNNGTIIYFAIVQYEIKTYNDNKTTMCPTTYAPFLKEWRLTLHKN